MVTTAWLRRTASYGLASTMALFGLTGIASAQTITNTGPGSTNQISSSYTNNCSVTNNNNVSANNYNNQSATTGSVNESGNTTAGVSWTGWSGLDPASAQANGTSYGSWWSGVVNWIGQRAGGNGWNSSQTNLSYAPSGNTWASYDPMTWQTNGQTFGNWYNAVESYLNGNSSAWVLGWPSDATGTGSFGSATGNATNNYNSNFSININNAARAAAGTNTCGQSNFTPPPTGGSGGGPTGSAPVGGSGGGSVTAPTGGNGGGYGNYGGYSGYGATAPRTISSPAPTTPNVPNTPTTPTGGSGGNGGGSGPSTPSGSISITGPGSSNSVSSSYTDNSSVTNNNNVSVSNSSTQYASSGNSNTSGNTTAYGGGTGNASNGNGSGYGVGISN